MQSRNHVIPVIFIGIYGIIIGMILFDEYFQRIELFKEISCIPCKKTLYLFLKNYLDYAVIMGVPIPFLVIILFILILGLGYVGFISAGRNPVINKASMLAVFMVSSIGVGVGAYLLYIMLYVLKVICPLCLTLDVSLWTLTAYTAFILIRGN